MKILNLLENMVKVAPKIFGWYTSIPPVDKRFFGAYAYDSQPLILAVDDDYFSDDDLLKLSDWILRYVCNNDLRCLTYGDTSHKYYAQIWQSGQSPKDLVREGKSPSYAIIWALRHIWKP